MQGARPSDTLRDTTWRAERPNPHLALCASGRAGDSPGMAAAANPFVTPSKSRPLVVGHRGVPRLHQENTLAGFRRAVALGISAVELDVQLTRDGRAVCLHDADLERLTGTRGNVRDLSWDELARLRVRRELPMGVGADGAPVIARYDREEPIPLLEEVLTEIAPRAAVNLELKLDLGRWWHIDVGAVVAGDVVRAGVADRVIVTSFDPRKLRAAQRVTRELAVGFCFDDGMLDFAAPLLQRFPGLARELISRMQPRAVAGPATAGPATHGLLTQLLDANLVGRVLGTQVVGAEHTLIGEHTVRRLHERGIAVGTHTLFPLGSTTGKPIAPAAVTEAEVERLVELGVDWIETDDPERLQELLA